ncbi:hypothetical protein [Amycolatopsis sp. NBC_01480]|jgi:hypothetical protein|uniref:hypothetical protein n=1 Tax=Amycolatopsis sp. NBC_01480 TaxID=2903562 RepID=UPI002E29B6B0|nr:hypothetical protein [Amycolatopsis sp. NBC_01480]
MNPTIAQCLEDIRGRDNAARSRAFEAVITATRQYRKKYAKLWRTDQVRPARKPA